ncbi:MAG: ABC transporter permease [Bacteroidota bacterium]
MFHSLTFSLRVLFKYRLYTFIALIGLSISIASIWFIADYVQKSYQYDAFHANQDRIYRLSMEITAGGSSDHFATTGTPLGDLMQQNYPEIESYVSLSFQDPVVHVNNEVFKESGIFKANSNVFEVFTFDFLNGNKENALNVPNSIILSKSLAEKYFGEGSVIGKQLSISETNYTVSGVFQDWPKNSHLEVNALLYKEGNAEYEAQSWFDMDQFTYLLTNETMTQADLDNRLSELKKEYLVPILEDTGVDVQFQAQSLNELYFSQALIDDVPKGNITYIHILMASGLLILLIAGLNYINLSLTQSTRRAKEISLKKILGITKKQLLKQSAAESLIMTLLVLLTAIGLVFVMDALYLKYSGFTSFGASSNWAVLFGMVLLVFVIGVVGLSYSGLYMTFTTKLLAKDNKWVNLFKRTLIGLQFAVATVILIITMSMNRQVDYMKNKDLGFSKDQVMVINLPGDESLKDRYLQFREELKKNTNISNAALIGWGALPGEENGKELFEVDIDGQTVEKIFNIYRIDQNYAELLDIEMAVGRNFQNERVYDRNETIMINESLAKSLNWKNPIGKKINCYGKEREIIGVVKNFHNKSLHHLIEPIVFIFDTEYPTDILVKTSIVDPNSIKTAWEAYFPNLPFSYFYFDQFIENMYTKENQLVSLLSFFTIVALLLSCMGLFAVFSLNVQQKMKEMSIRKVLGASGINLLQSITKNYVLVAFLAIGLALPAAYLFLSNWLEGFSYKIQLNPVIFVISILLVFIVSFLTMSYHVNKLITINPVDNLKE